MEISTKNHPVYRVGHSYLLNLYRQVTRSPSPPSDMRLCAFLNRLIDISRLSLEIDMDNEPELSPRCQVLIAIAAEKLVNEDPTWISPEALASDNKRLRRMLALQVAGPTLYMDDGELSDSSKRPCIDFKRDSVERIEQALRARSEKAWRGVDG